MDVYNLVLEVIDLRSFSNLWYWIGLAVLWSTATHWVLGVPYDMVLRARRNGGEAEADLQDIVRVNCKRILRIGHTLGLMLMGLGSALLSGLAILGFWYGVEFAQAVFLMLFPLSVVTIMTMRAARLIQVNDEAGEVLYKRLRLQHLLTRVIGMLAIFVTATWGMYQNLYVGPLGG